MNKRPREIDMPIPLLQQLRIYEQLLGKSTNSMPYRGQIQLFSLIESLAVLKGEHTITQDDVNIIGYLSKWLNYDFNQI